MGKRKKRKKPSQEKKSAPEEASLQAKPEERKRKKKLPALKNREHPNWPLTALAGAGMVLTAYLVLTTWLGGKPLYCAEGSSCDIVQQSRWGTFLGLPTALWGFLTYAALAHIGYRVRSAVRHWKWAWTVSLAGLGYSVYLIAVSLFVIDAACVYCLASFSIMTAIFCVVLFQRPAGLPDFSFAKWAGQTAVVALVLVGGMHLHYSGVFDPAAGPEDPYLKGLAEHLAREKALMYGAFW
ncbi:MAG: vitamin K epoxide reductase family protein [Nitrospiraceae bacterium]|nr:MAG: vitamin K epoxide reductase family protein [Nitrospiraceae bacterium]